MNEKKNKEYYDDLTAYEALRNVETEQRANKLVAVLKYIIKMSGFELVKRIHLRDKKTGKEYK